MSKKEDFISVSAFNSIIKELLEENLSDNVKIKGEVSNLKMSGGNTFFTLKDANSSISVVSWRNTFEIENGDDIFVNGKLNCWQKQGTYNIQAYGAERIGKGNILDAYEKQKKIFEKMGYFAKKREFPTVVNKIGIVSAYNGDALQDILAVLTNNKFFGNVYVKNCFAQGKYCAKSVKEGIEYFNKLEDKVDIILISRGGGSTEDLMGYSEESVVKAIWQSEIFTISAVGHEMNWMFADFAADHRSATPTRAAEDISCVCKNLLEEFEMCESIVKNLKIMTTNLFNNIQKQIENNKNLLNILSPSKIVENELVNLKNIKRIFYNKILQKIENIKYKIESLKLKNQSFDMINNFHNGFVMVIDENNKIIKSAIEFKKIKKSKQTLKIIFADGDVLL